MKLRRLSWVLAILLLAGAGAATAFYLANRRDVTTSSRAAYEAYREAVANEECFYFKEARVGYARALELDPNFAMAMLGLARQSGDRDQALALVRRAAREEDRLNARERLHVEMARAIWEKRETAALDIAREIRAKYPDDVRAATSLAHEQLAKGNPDAAIRIFEDLLAVDPNNAEAYNQIGYQYGFRGEYEKAVESLKKYEFISPNSANPLDSLGENQAYAGHYNEAIENLNRALAIKPDFEPAYEHLGVAYEGMGEYAKAVESYGKAAELASTSEMTRQYLVEALRAAFIAKDRTAVHALADRIGKIPPTGKDEYGAIRRELLATLLDLVDGHPADTERRLDALKPSLEKLWQEEHKAGKTLLGAKPHFREWNFFMAVALEAQGRTDEALKLYELNANPPNPYGEYESRRWIMEARAKVAAIVARKGDLDRAEKLIAENRKWNPSWGPCRPAEAEVAELRRAKVLAASK